MGKGLLEKLWRREWLMFFPAAFVPFVLQLHHRKHDRHHNPAHQQQRLVTMQVHAVPDAERAFDSQGRRLPWGLEFAE